MSVNMNTQGDYALRKTGNYFDQIEGNEYHLQPITFHEFLSKAESLFMYDPLFFQIPGYVQKGAELPDIEETARQYVVEYIRDEFEHNLLGMQDYVRWGKLFEHRCAEITAAFWGQVNMHDLMFAKDLEMDENQIERSNTGGASRIGNQTTTTDSSGESETKGKTTSTQDVTNTQATDGTTREAQATVVRADDQLTDSIDYNWSDSADSVHEVRSRAGDTQQHMDSETNSESGTTSSSHSASTTVSNSTDEQSGAKSNEKSNLTNKQFMQEKQWAIDTAQKLLPLTWLRQALRPMFYMIY